MIAVADLTSLPNARPDSSPTVKSPWIAGLFHANSRRAGRRPAALNDQPRVSSPIVDTRAMVTEAERSASIVGCPGDPDSWLFSAEANSLTLGWTGGGGLGADLGRSEPVIQDEVEELVNTITHGFGLILSLVGLYGLAMITRLGTPSVLAAGCAVYGISMVFLYAASTFYHARREGRGKRVLLLFDYIGIYLLIAGTYTPMVIINLGGPVGWSLLAIVWGIAAIGTAVKINRIDRFENDSPLPYLAMSGVWLVVFRQIITAVPAVEFLWLLAGGAFYICGFAFYARADRRFFHSLWHVLVLAGSICHFRAVIGCLNTLTV
jgi:hemolysin III